MKPHLVAALTLLVALSGCDDSTPRPDGGTPPGTDSGTPPGQDSGTPGTDSGTPEEDAGSVTPTSPLVDPSCLDGQFSETLPDPDADISDLVAGYSAADPVAFIDGSLRRRYPSGAEMVAGGRGTTDCATVFLRDTSSAQEIIEQLGTVVHECGHFYDNTLSRTARQSYYINDSPLTLVCQMGDTTSRGGLTFERSRILNDSWSSGRPGCPETGPRPDNCDFYARVYLDGNPDDDEFEGGDQGFNMLFEELVQYVNSLATSFAYTNELNSGGRSSQKDGLLTFLWYTMRYLHMARNDYPAAYEHILNGDGGCWRRAILQVWGRAFLYLEATEGMTHLGINDTLLMGLVETPELLQEIQRLRDAEGCGA
ncbi:MAG: hypothetical protein AB8I08_05320 [Sandaracinaceae bacterium]